MAAGPAKQEALALATHLLIAHRNLQSIIVAEHRRRRLVGRHLVERAPELHVVHLVWVLELHLRGFCIEAKSSRRCNVVGGRMIQVVFLSRRLCSRQVAMAARRGGHVRLWARLEVALGEADAEQRVALRLHAR